MIFRDFPAHSFIFRSNGLIFWYKIVQTIYDNRLEFFSQGDEWFLSYRRLKIEQNFEILKTAYTKVIVTQLFLNILTWTFREKKEENLGFLVGSLNLKFDNQKLTYLR